MNRLGDVELSARGIRVLAHPVRLAMLQRLREDGPSTATLLAPLVGTSPSTASWHLRHLAEHGLVEDLPDRRSGRSRWWRAVGRGFTFEMDPHHPGAADALSSTLEAAEANFAQEWTEATRPQLEPAWLAASSRRNTGVVVTLEELRQLDDEIEQLLAPLVNRAADATPPDARQVRLLLQFFPTAGAGL